MGRDDWMYDEDSLEEAEEDVRKDSSGERQCSNCLRFVASDTPYCGWCGRPFEEPRRR